MDSEKMQGLCSDRCPTTSCDTNQAIRLKEEVLSGAEEEDCPVPFAFVGIKAETEVSYVSVRRVS
jgi:hypothetical protein